MERGDTRRKKKTLILLDRAEKSLVSEDSGNDVETTGRLRMDLQPHNSAATASAVARLTLVRGAREWELVPRS